MLLVASFDPGKLQAAHGGTICAHEGLPAHPDLFFGSAFGCLKPGMAQEPLRQEGVAKVYVVFKGAACIVADGEEYNVKAGDVVFFPPGTPHQVHHEGDGDFVDFCFWWSVGDGSSSS